MGWEYLQSGSSVTGIGFSKMLSHLRASLRLFALELLTFEAQPMDTGTHRLLQLFNRFNCRSRFAQFFLPFELKSYQKFQHDITIFQIYRSNKSSKGRALRNVIVTVVSFLVIG